MHVWEVHSCLVVIYEVCMICVHLCAVYVTSWYTEWVPVTCCQEEWGCDHTYTGLLTYCVCILTV